LARGGKRKEREEKREEKKQEYKPEPKGNAKKPDNTEKGKQKMTTPMKKIENSKPRETKTGQKN
jgi:hypothetical protein